MTDNEIIKALECCSPKQNRSCGICPAYDLGNFCASELKQNALDLITRQQAELENLKVENQSLRSAANSLKMHYEETQGAEAVKDFCICNAFKYLYRHRRKNGSEDIAKAKWYLDKYLEIDKEQRNETNI